jgi:hypothetical protein
MANIISSTARTVSPRSFATLALAISMIALMTNGSFARTIRLDNGYSPGELSKECKDNHGTFKAGGTAYECIGKGGTVVCTGDGTKAGATCTGSCPKCGTSAAKSIGISGILHPSLDKPTKGKQQ